MTNRESWWRYQQAPNEGQAKLRVASARNQKAQADDILARPGARLPTGDFNPRIVSREDARIVAQAYPRLPEQAGRKPITGFEALGNLGRAGPSIAAEFLPGETGRRFRAAREELGPLEAFRQAEMPSVRVPEGLRRGVRAALQASLPSPARRLTEPLAEAVVPRQLGVKGALEGFAQPDILLPGVGSAVRVARAGGRAALRGAEEALVRAPGRVLPEAGLRLAGAKGVAGGAIPLETHEVGARIKNFLDAPLEARFKATNKAVEDTSYKMDAIAGTRPDEYFVVLARPKGLKYPDPEKMSKGLWEFTSNRIGSDSRLFFKSFDDVDQFLRTGEYKAPSITSPLRPGPIKPLYKTAPARVEGPPPDTQAVAATREERFFEGPKRLFDNAPVDQQQGILEVAGVQQRQDIVKWTDLNQSDRMKVFRVLEGPQGRDVAVATERARSKAQLENLQRSLKDAQEDMADQARHAEFLETSRPFRLNFTLRPEDVRRLKTRVVVKDIAVQKINRVFEDAGVKPPEGVGEFVSVEGTEKLNELADALLAAGYRPLVSFNDGVRFAREALAIKQNRVRGLEEQLKQLEPTLTEAPPVALRVRGPAKRTTGGVAGTPTQSYPDPAFLKSPNAPTIRVRRQAETAGGRAPRIGGNVPGRAQPPAAPGMTGAEILARVGRTIRALDINAQEGDRLIRESIRPAFEKLYGDSPVMRFVPNLGEKEPLLAISTAGWRQRAEAIGLQFVREHGFADEYRLPLAERAVGVSPPSPAGAPPGGRPPRRPPTTTGGEPLLPPPPPGPRIMGDLSPIDEVISISQRPDVWRDIANRPGLRTIFGALNPSAVANSPAHAAVVGRAILRDQGQQLSQVANARLNALGTQGQVFGSLTKEGLIADGPLKGLTVNTIRSNPGQYADKMTPAMKEWVKVADDIERAKLSFLRENGVELTELAFEEGGQYAGRRVFGKITQGGEFLDSGYVGAGPGARPGAKLAAEKHRIFETAEEAIEQGYRYIPDDEALFFNVQGAYNRVADKRMADWLLLQVPWRTTAAPDALKLAAYQANQKLHRSRQLLAALNRAVRGERLPDSTIASIGAAYPEQAQALKAIVSKLQGPRPQTARAVQALTVDAKRLITEAQRDYAQAVSSRATARERAATTTFEEARIQAPAFAGKIFTGPEAKETARILRESMEPGFNRALGAINQANSVSRYFQLAGDASPMTIQLLYLAGANPKAYAGAGKGFVQALLDTRFQARYLARPENVAIMQKYPGLILTRGGQTEFTEAMARGGLLRKGPLKYGAMILEPFQRGFEGALDVAGIEWAKALDHLGTDAARRADLGQFINEFRGVTSSARLGVSAGMRQAETAALLAPRYNRAIASLLFDTIHGGLRGELARKSLAQGVAAVAATGVAISWAMGETPDEILEHLDPTSPRFMTWQVAGQNVGPGSKLRSVLRLFALSAKDPEKLLDTSVGWGELEYMRNPLIKFGRGLASPVASKSWDLITGKDFIGDPTRDSLLTFTKTVAETFMPIWTQTVAFEGGSVGARVTRGLAEFAGGRAFPRNLLFELSDEWRGDLQPYRDIPTDSLKLTEGQSSRTDYRKDNPDVDAKLFITGAVSSLETFAAVDQAVKLIRDSKVDPDFITAIKGRKQRLADAAKAGRHLERTKVDRLIEDLEAASAQPAPATTTLDSFFRPQGQPTKPPSVSDFFRKPTPTPVGVR